MSATIPAIRRPGAVGRHFWRPDNPAAAARSTHEALWLIALFGLLALITRALCRDIDNQSPFWPANGAVVAALLVLPPRTSWLVCLACLGINIALNLATTYTVTEDVLYAVLNIAMSYVAAILTRRYCGARSDLLRMRRLARFVPIALLAAGIEAVFGETIDVAGWEGHPVAMAVQWALCDGLGLVMATPVALLALNRASHESSTSASLLEKLILFYGCAILTCLSFYGTQSSLCLMIYPALMLVAFRAGQAWVLAAVLLNALVATAFTCHGRGPIALLASSAGLDLQHAFQPFLVSLFLCVVPANNVLGDKDRAARRLQRLKTTIEAAAAHDALTGLLNRAAFLRRLDLQIRQPAGFALLLVDLDRFKDVNDTMGHSAGDRLLHLFAVRLRHLAASGAAVARLGGDEFAMLVPLPESGLPMDIAGLCDTIIRAAQAPFTLAAGIAHIGASIGVAVAPAPGPDATEMIRRADVALYDAKARGRNQCRVFSPDLDQAAFDRAALKADLRMALDAGDQLRLFYQPREDQMSRVARGRQHFGAEALLRWFHPVKGLLPTNLVIAAAEESGLILPLGEWVLREALEFAARWPNIDLAVNVSPMQLRHPDFVDGVQRAIAASGMDPRRLELEITETAIIEDADSVIDKLRCLRRLGIRIALDDFGTGFSSLQHLQRYAVDRLKIDRSFVGLLESSPQAKAIVTAVTSLGHAMDLQVTAEGVETPAQRRFLIDAGVDELQGYLIGRPMAERDFALWHAAATDEGLAPTALPLPA